MIDNTEFVVCKICGFVGKCLTFYLYYKHSLTPSQYLKMFVGEKFIVDGLNIPKSPNDKRYSEEFRKNNSERMKKNNPMQNIIYRTRARESKIGMRPWNKGVKGYSTLRKGQHHSVETKKLMQENHWSKKSPEAFRKFVIEKRPNNPTNYERLLADELIKNNFTIVTQYPVGTYRIDIYLPVYLLCVEVDGYEKSDKRKNFIRNNGYKLIHLKNAEVAENIAGCIDKIKKEVGL